MYLPKPPQTAPSKVAHTMESSHRRQLSPALLFLLHTNLLTCIPTHTCINTMQLIFGTTATWRFCQLNEVATKLHSPTFSHQHVHFSYPPSPSPSPSLSPSWAKMSWAKTVSIVFQTFAFHHRYCQLVASSSYFERVLPGSAYASKPTVAIARRVVASSSQYCNPVRRTRIVGKNKSNTRRKNTHRLSGRLFRSWAYLLYLF